MSKESAFGKIEWERFFPFIVIAAGIIAYANSFSNPFIFDDWSIIRNDPGISLLFLCSYSSRFIADTTFKLNYAFGGFNVADYHATNLFIHIMAGLLLYGVIRRTLLLPVFASKFQESASCFAVACATIWTVHPLQTESVTYLCQRYESLMGLFLLLCLYSVVRAESSHHRRLWYNAALGACVLGIGRKQSMVIAPFVVLLYDHIFLSPSFRNLFREKWKFYMALFFTLGIFPLLHLNSVRAVIAAGGIGLKAQPVSPHAYLFTQFGVVVHYLKLSVCPYPLCLDYAWPVAVGWQEILLPAVFIGLLLAAMFYALYRRLPIGFVGAWFFMTLLPSSGLVPITDMASERRMYLPLASVVCIVVFSYSRLRGLVCRSALSRRAIDVAAFLAVAGVLTCLTIERNVDYKSEYGMLAKTVAARPHNFRAHVGLISCLLADGRLDEADLTARLFLQRLAAAEADKTIRYRGIAAGNVDYYIPEAHSQYGRVLLAKGKLREAIDQFNEAIRLRPDCQAYYNNLALAVLLAGDPNAAIKICRTAIAVDPGYARGYALLGYILAREGRRAEAVGAYRQSLKLAPDAPDQVVTECELAWLLATSPDAGCRNGAEALRLGLSVCEATGHQSIRALDILAAAYAEKGDYEAAVRTARKALSLGKDKVADSASDADSSGMDGLMSGRANDQRRSIEARISLYEARQPFRDAAPDSVKTNGEAAATHGELE